MPKMTNQLITIILTTSNMGITSIIHQSKVVPVIKKEKFVI
jgi:hypothetical protein